MKAIEIARLCKTFRGKKGNKVEALKDLSFDVQVGEIFGFLGPNGAGKSTTIKTLMGLITPSSGVAKIMGEDATSYQSRRKVGYLPENPAFYDYLSAQEYLEFVGSIYGMSPEQAKEKTDYVLDLLELQEARRRPIRGYSKGMVQRLGLGTVLLHDPDVYILDEPMSGLDPVGRALVKDIIIGLKHQGKSVFFSTHITSDVETVCDRVGIIVKGELQSVEFVQEILKEGLSAYSVKLIDGDSEEDLHVPKDQIDEFILAARAKGKRVAMIEPVRKNLEEFFLRFVRKES